MGKGQRLQMLNPLREREILLEFIDAKGVRLDMAFCGQIPNAMKFREQGWDDIWLAGKLNPYFATLDKLAAKSYKPAIDRVVVLHHSHSVGWHVHFQMATPPTMSQVDFAGLAYRQWRRTLGAFRHCAFEQQALWSEPVIAGHMPYMLGHLSIDRVDWENTHFTS
jgi:hypothetical protein